MPRNRIDLPHAVSVLRTFYRKQKRPPSYDEIRNLFHYRSKNAAYWLVQKLENAGVAHRDSKGKLILDNLHSTKLLGTVSAGFPNPAEEELIDTMSLDEYLIQNPESTYLIKVTGDSMKDAGIHEGDLVLVERGRQPQNRDIVIAQVDGEWTMKYYEKTKRGVFLIPANKKYKPIQPRQELMIGGVVISVIRKYK